MSDHQAPVFVCEDPLGRTITLDAPIWHVKILPKHRELESNASAVQTTLSKPDIITADASFSDRECYYRRGALRSVRRGYLKVCVAFREDGLQGRVVTAYLVAALPRSSEEVPLWP